MDKNQGGLENYLLSAILLNQVVCTYKLEISAEEHGVSWIRLMKALALMDFS